MPVYRYKLAGIDINKVKKQVPPADAASVSSGSSGALVVWDVTAPTTSKDDIDDYLSTRGWTFVETDPSDTPQEASDDAIQAAAPEAHDLAGSLHNADTLAGLNAKISDATLDTNTASRPPSGSATGDLSGSYPNPTVPHIALTNNPHSVTAAQAGAAPSAEGVTNGNSHDHNGGDGAQIDHVNLSNKGTNTHAQVDTHLAASAPHSGHAATDHDATHIRAGSDEIDGDKLDIDWNPTNYTPATTPTEVTHADELTAHLYGIDQALATAGSVFGTEYDYEEKTTQDSTTSSWKQYMRMTTASLPAGTYRIGWMYVWRYSDVNDEFQCRLQVDDTTNLINPSDGTYPYHRQEPTDGGTDQRWVTCGFRHVTLGAGAHNIDMDFGGDGDTAYMFHGQIEIWRVS